MDETFEKIYNENNTGLKKDTALFEKVYAEAEMLNEMNPKLRALLAAGLIGTAGLGAASCSTSVDNPYDAPQVEQPAPETPGSTTEETDTTETPETPETPVTFESLGVTLEQAECLARARKDPSTYTQIIPVSGFDSYRYKGNGFGSVGFKTNEKGEEGQWDGDGRIYIRYIDIPTSKIFYVPENKINDFDTAIAAY